MIPKSDFFFLFFSREYLLLQIVECGTSNKRHISTYIPNSSFGQAPNSILACTVHSFASIMQTFLSLFFLIHYALASGLGMIRPRDQADQLVDLTPEESPSDESVAETPGNQLITSGDTIGHNEPGFERQQQQQQTWLKSPEASSPLAVGGGDTAQCNNGAESILPEQSFITPRRFWRSSSLTRRHAKRQSKTFFCPVVPEPQKLQNGGLEEEAPINNKPETKKSPPEVGQAANSKKNPGISLPIVQNIIMQIRMWGSILQQAQEGVCGSVEVPICVPMLPMRKYPTQQQSFSHYVVPVRFCKFLLHLYLGVYQYLSPLLSFHLFFKSPRRKKNMRTEENLVCIFLERKPLIWKKSYI